MPRIISLVIETNGVDASVRSSLENLDREIRGGVVQSPFSARAFPQGCFEEEELQTWEEEIAPREGRPWPAIPWYFAEAFFYLKVLVAFGHYDTAARSRDPFLPQKEKELLDPEGGLTIGRRALSALEGASGDDAVTFLLHSSLWGNRVDLSMFEVDTARRRSVLARDRDLLVVDDTKAAVQALSAARCVHFIMDNAGPELVCDLLLADRLLSGGRALVLHAKKAPMFVSDATVRDVTRTVEALAGHVSGPMSAVGARLRSALKEGRLVIREHWFWNSARFFTRMPGDIREVLSAADVVVVKGDANYRRLLEDRRWETSLSLDELAAWFPAPFVALRTMKSEVVVDVPAGEARRLALVDPEWLINGRRGLIRYCNNTRAAPSLWARRKLK